MQEAYNDIFIRDVLVEAHGMLFDILIIGTFIFALHELVEKRRERKSKIKRWQEEIDDYRGWDEKEATIKIVGNIMVATKKEDFIGHDELCLDMSKLLDQKVSITYRKYKGYLLEIDKDIRKIENSLEK